MIRVRCQDCGGIIDLPKEIFNTLRNPAEYRCLQCRRSPMPPRRRPIPQPMPAK